jgi:beta-glucuronidase
MNFLRTTAAAMFALMTLASTAFAAERISLDGSGWTFKTTLDNPVPVEVPHCWTGTERWRHYIGSALYQHDFDAPTLKPGQVVRLHFDAVYDVATVWVNGKRLGTHEGGYTAFEYDVTSLLKPGKNRILVEVNNTPTISSIPALATGNPSSADNNGRITIVGWLPYGGIVRPVSLLVTDAVYLRNMKVDAKPDLKTGDATITVHAWAHNGSNTDRTSDIEGTVAGLAVSFPHKRIAANSDEELTWTGKLSHAHLWSVADPFLYDAHLQTAGDALDAKMGVRDIRVVGTELQLNGKTVHLYGANRVGEDPIDGLIESDATIERDMSDMLALNMRMMRIAHYPQPPALLDYADKHGMLIIPEAGNWNMSSWQMADPDIRQRFQKQQQEMIEQEWNHPSVIAWSVGNEYEAYTEEGKAWTRDMRAFSLKLDPTRLITFADRYTSDPAVKKGSDDASQYCDFVSINIYGGYAKRLDYAHQLYPDKPIFVTEFGKMGEPGLHDPKRIADITDAVTAMKERPWVIGGSLWTWADYRSFISGTPDSGIRSWGVVDFLRQKRDSYTVVQQLFKTELP